LSGDLIGVEKFIKKMLERADDASSSPPSHQEAIAEVGENELCVDPFSINNSTVHESESLIGNTNETTTAQSISSPNACTSEIEEADITGAASNICSAKQPSEKRRVPKEDVGGSTNTDCTVESGSCKSQHEVRDASLQDSNGEKMIEGSSKELSSADPPSPHDILAKRVSKHNRHGSSLELRKLPVDVLLKPFGKNDPVSTISDEFLPTERKRTRKTTERRGILHCLCLRPAYSLRTQLMLSFGTLSALATIFVVITCIAVSAWAAGDVNDEYSREFVQLGERIQGRTARYLAESVSDKLLPVGLVDRLQQATQDRFAGYPSPTDEFIPFRDMISGKRVYPIIGSPIPLEWQLEPNINATNYNEHVHGRDYYRNIPANTEKAGYFFQGMCNPKVTNTMDFTYWPNCTDANNDIGTGGVVAPSPTTEMIHRKGSDLVPIMRMLFESKKEIADIGIHFVNSGAGAVVQYPHAILPTLATYRSDGCSWLSSANPYNSSRSIGTPAMIEGCRAEGEMISFRSFNPLERGWCARQAINPDRFTVDVVTDPTDPKNKLRLLLGRSIYDYITGELIACLAFSISVNTVQEEIENARVTNGTHVSIASWNDVGSVLTSTDRSIVPRTPIFDTSIGITKTAYEELYTLVDYDKAWVPVDANSAYEKFESEHDNTLIVSVHPLPPIPNEYDPSYRPSMIMFISTPVDFAVEVLDEVDEIVDDKMQTVTKWSIIAGAIGIGVSTFIIFAMANMLTSPLRDMSRIANEIVSNFGDPNKDQRIDQRSTREAACTPRTELSDVVSEFNKMVANFSGTMLVKSEEGKRQEIDNCELIRHDLEGLYQKRDGQHFPYRVKPPAQLAKAERVSYSGTDMSHENKLKPEKISKPSNSKGRKGALFLWTVGLIVTPLLVVNITISVWVMTFVSNEYTKISDETETFYLETKSRARVVHTRLRANTVSSFMQRSANDLFFTTRYLSWILFGGLQRSGFLQTVSGMETCKNYSIIEECPAFQQHANCDCAWEEPSAETCTTYSSTVESMLLQIPIFSLENDKPGPNGDRYNTSFPDVAYSPNSTTWWEDPLSAPGWDHEINNSGYDTSYTRLQAASSLPIPRLLYNSERKNDVVYGSFIGFEADGLTSSFQGCRTAYEMQRPRWKSTVGNRAADIRGELCPLHKYGYDPR